MRWPTSPGSPRRSRPIWSCTPGICSIDPSRPSMRCRPVWRGWWPSPTVASGRWWWWPGITTRRTCSRRWHRSCKGFGVHLVGKIKRPDDGGVLTIDTNDGPAHVACFPFLRAAQAVDFMERADKWYGGYADRIRRVCEVYAEDVGERRKDGGVGVLVAHFMVGGIKVMTGVPRGERELHMGEAYAATSQAIPTALDYVAMGHIHAPQPVPGASVPAEYAGSLLQLDFGETGEEKRVVLVEASSSGPASLRSIPLAAGRPLVRASGDWDVAVGSGRPGRCVARSVRRHQRSRTGPSRHGPGAFPVSGEGPGQLRAARVRRADHRGHCLSPRCMRRTARSNTAKRPTTT